MKKIKWPQWLMNAIDWPAYQWRLARHKYYYGRLEYQYQAGRAEGLREGLLNREAYFDMTHEELGAATGRKFTSERDKDAFVRACVAGLPTNYTGTGS